MVEPVSTGLLAKLAALETVIERLTSPVRTAILVGVAIVWMFVSAIADKVSFVQACAYSLLAGTAIAYASLGYDAGKEMVRRWKEGPPPEPPRLTFAEYEGKEVGLQATNIGGIAKIRVYGRIIKVDGQRSFRQKEFVYNVVDKLKNGANVSVDLAHRSGATVWIQQYLGAAWDEWMISGYSRINLIVAVRYVHLDKSERTLSHQMVKITSEDSREGLRIVNREPVQIT